VLASSSFTDAVIRGVSLHGKSRFNDIEALVHTVGTPFVEPLLMALTSESNRSNRLFYLKLLQQLDAGEVIPLAVRYLNDTRWFIVRNIILILRNIQQPEVVAYLRPLMDHPHLKIRIEAIRTCLHYGCDEATLRLIEMLDDKDNQTVDIAISMAMMVKDANVAGRLVALLQNNPVINYRLDQKKAIVKTLAETIPKGALPVFFELLSKKNALHPNQHKELIAEILKVFERYDPKLLIPAIEQYAPSVNADIQHRLRRLQKRMES
jgi:HEAT repeat protein